MVFYSCIRALLVFSSTALVVPGTRRFPQDILAHPHHFSSHDVHSVQCLWWRYQCMLFRNVCPSTADEVKA